ncbi:MAG: hypothetical protein HQL76_02120 [Magnetococcales bacterium]|nr:hypothetical protein [Magnetococcales bacterium]
MAENQDSELDNLIQASAPGGDAEKAPREPKEEPPKKSGMSPMTLAMIGVFIAVLAMGYMTLDGYVTKKNAELEAEFQRKRVEYRIQAHRRMYDTLQGQIQVEMMDRMKNQGGPIGPRQGMVATDVTSRSVGAPDTSSEVSPRLDPPATGLVMPHVAP